MFQLPRSSLNDLAKANISVMLDTLDTSQDDTPLVSSVCHGSINRMFVVWTSVPRVRKEKIPSRKKISCSVIASYMWNPKIQKSMKNAIWMTNHNLAQRYVPPLKASADKNICCIFSTFEVS